MTAGNQPSPQGRAPSRRAVLRGGLGGLLGVGLAVASASVAHADLPTYQRGASGDFVAALQKYLAGKGYWCGAADGDFGQLTQQAVWAQQKAAGLKTDGIVGWLTLTALARDPLPQPTRGQGDYVEIDLAKQLLMLVHDGRSSLVLNTSTGNGQPYDWYGQQLSARTPTGDFEVYQTHPQGWQSGPLGDLYRPQYFNGGIAVHGAPAIPPYPASHGCCRVSVAAMDMIWATEAMQLGTPVTVTPA